MAQIQKKNKKTIEYCIPTLILEWDDKGNIIHSSPYFAEKCGFKIYDNFINKCKHIDTLFVTPKFSHIKELFKEKSSISDFSIVVKDNTENRFLLIVDELQFNKKNKKYKAIFKVESESFDSKITDDAPIGMFISTPEGKFIKVNQTLVDIYGYKSKNEMLNIENISEEIYANPEDRKVFIEEIKNKNFEKGTQNKKIIEKYKYVANRVDGRKCLIEKYVIATYELGEISFFQGYVEDVSRFMEYSPLPYFRSDMKGNIIYANKALYQWLEYSEEEIYKKKVKELYLNPEDAKYWKKKLDKEKKLIASPRTFKSKNGKSIKVYVDVSLHERNGKSIYVDGHLFFNSHGAIKLLWTDELKQHLSSEDYEASIAQVNKLKDEMHIVSLSSEEIQKLAVDISRVIKDHNSKLPNPNKSDFKSSSFLSKQYSLNEKIELAVWHCLSFITKKRELLKDSLTITQVSQLLELSKKEIEKKVSQNKMIRIFDNQIYYFPLCQFDFKQKDGILSELDSILNILKVSNLEKLSWLKSTNSMLKDRKPIDILKNGTPEEKQLVKEEAFVVGDC